MTCRAVRRALCGVACIYKELMQWHSRPAAMHAFLDQRLSKRLPAGHAVAEQYLIIVITPVNIAVNAIRHIEVKTVAFGFAR